MSVHAPFYHTYQGHFKEVECMRQAYEPLLVKYQVDLVMSGHVHSYERTKPLVNYQVQAKRGEGGYTRPQCASSVCRQDLIS